MLNDPKEIYTNRQCVTSCVCSFCDSKNINQVMDFGEVALAGGFLKKEQFHHEKKFPLSVYYCEDCYALQVINIVNPDILFKDYFYFSSAINTLRDHFEDYAKEVTERFLEPHKATVVEFGCNDGVLLKPLADQGIKTVIGVDPAKNIVNSINDQRVTIVNDFFTEEVAEQIVSKYGKVDVVMANNVYAHIPDIQGTTRAITKVLNDEGVFIFEVHYLGKVIDELQYDMIYHEHLYYYSLLSAIKHFERYNMMVFDIQSIPIHAGSIRFYVCKKGSKYSKNISQNVKNLEQEEYEKGYDRYETFKLFYDRVCLHRTKLISTLNDLKKSGAKIAGYGASGRANTIIQFCGINNNHLDYMIDDSPAKRGYYAPGSHFKIYPSSVLLETDAPDYVLVFAWSFINEIRKRNAEYIKNGGHFILPLPEVTIL